MIKPFVSIVIPTWRTSKILSLCLESLYNQDYPKKNFEIILISPKSLNIHHTRVKTVKISKGLNHAEARNMGVSVSKGSIIAFCDDDCILPSNWLTSGVSYFKNNKIDLVGGPVTPPYNLSFKYRLGGYLSGSRFTVGFAASRYRPVDCIKKADESNLILANTFITKSAFISCGGFEKDQVPCEENSLCFKMKKKGYNLIYSPKVTCNHPAKPILFPWAKKVFFYATGRGQLLARTPATFKIQFVIPSLFIFSLCILIPLSFFWILPRIIFLSTILTYLMLNLANALKLYFVAENNLAIIMVAPIATFIIHIAYGLGFGYGFFRYLSGKHGASKMPSKI
jgi:GT2 family glycosyltransferase